MQSHLTADVGGLQWETVESELSGAAGAVQNFQEKQLPSRSGSKAELPSVA